MMGQIAHNITVPLMHMALVLAQFITAQWSIAGLPYKLNDHIVVYLFGTLGPVDT